MSLRNDRDETGRRPEAAASCTQVRRRENQVQYTHLGRSGNQELDVNSLVFRALDLCRQARHLLPRAPVRAPARRGESRCGRNPLRCCRRLRRSRRRQWRAHSRFPPVPRIRGSSSTINSRSFFMSTSNRDRVRKALRKQDTNLGAPLLIRNNKANAAALPWTERESSFHPEEQRREQHPWVERAQLRMRAHRHFLYHVPFPSWKHRVPGKPHLPRGE